MSGELEYRVVDVFADRAYAGNPLAVVLGGENLSTGQMQAMAREFNLSETVFPLPPPEGADYGLRIFTPQVELPFAGHPSIGAAWVLKDTGTIHNGPRTQACGAGLLPVEVTEDGAVLTGGTASVGDELDEAPLLEAVGLGAADFAGVPPRQCGAGIDFAFLLVREEAVARAEPDPARLRAVGGSGVSVSSWSAPRAHARVFAAGVGVAEDPATGSAALGFGVFLAASGLLPEGSTAYRVEQGAEIGRPSVLSAEVEVTGRSVRRVRVGGSVVPVARGWITPPAG